MPVKKESEIPSKDDKNENVTYFVSYTKLPFFWPTVLIVGSILATIIIHRVSLLLFIIWTGALGALAAWKFVRWRLELDAFAPDSPIPDKHTKLQCNKNEKYCSRKVEGPQEIPICGDAECLCQTTPESGEMQPWIGLNIPKKVDSALEEFLTHVLERFVYSWYRKITTEDAAIDELRVGLRFLVARLFLRLKKVNLTEFISREIIPAVATHLVQHVHSHRKVGRYNADRIRLWRNRVHRSQFTREDELIYLKHLTHSILPFLLSDNVKTSRSLKLLLEELIAGMVLLPGLDKLADPDFINNLLIIMADDEPPPVNPDPPSESVEILGHFSLPNSTMQSFYCHDLCKILDDQTLLMSFMDVMKENGGLRFLQFFLTLDDFKKELLSNESSPAKLKQLEDEALHMYRVFCRSEAKDFVDLGPELTTQFRLSSTRDVAERGEEGIRDLRVNGEFISRAYDYLYNLMECYYLPIFRHSKQYFTRLYGEKHAKPDFAPWVSRSDRRGFSLSSRLRSSFKGDRGGGSLSGSNSNLKDLDSSPCSTPDCVSLQDEDFGDETIGEDEFPDMSGWSVELPSISIQPDSRSRTCLFFQIRVYKSDPNMTLSEENEAANHSSRCSVFRAYNDFYSLEQKLKQFHGAKLCKQLPPKRIFGTIGHEYLDGVKPKFEAFLKNVLNTPELKNSELLHNFLTAEDFSKGTAADVRIENVLKSMPGKLVKERGQNLKGFLKSFQSSTIPKPPRPDLTRCSGGVDDGDSPTLLIDRHLNNRLYEKSHIRQLSNGVAVEPNNHLLTDSCETSAREPANAIKLSSVVDCIARIEEVFVIPKRLHMVLVTVTLLAKDWIDSLITYLIHWKLGQVLEEHRIESLIKLLQDNIFYGDGLTRTDDQRDQRKRKALADVKNLVQVLHKVLGEKPTDTALEEMFDVLQHPKLNKQLIYILLNTIINEQSIGIVCVTADIYPTGHHHVQAVPGTKLLREGHCSVKDALQVESYC
ncbi:sorting nexin-14-like isoform X2 [Watersipora subatra]|uniref:sorting nexin-14-like isoform X2 n=1 Tax=Watersipora subatra TaxID=2589382 RepID=UPI00355B982B